MREREEANYTHSLMEKPKEMLPLTLMKYIESVEDFGALDQLEMESVWGRNRKTKSSHRTWNLKLDDSSQVFRFFACALHVFIEEEGAL